MYRLSVNVAGLTRYPSVIASILVGPVIPHRELVRAEPDRFDGGAVILECERTQADAIVRILRDDDTRNRRPKLRAYTVNTRGRWVAC